MALNILKGVSISRWALMQGVQMAHTFRVRINSNVSAGSNPTWGHGVRQATIAHAIGHIYGLDDFYYQDGHCRPISPNGASTIMNGAVYSNPYI